MSVPSSSVGRASKAAAIDEHVDEEVGTGSASDGDADAILGMILLCLAALFGFQLRRTKPFGQRQKVAFQEDAKFRGQRLGPPQAAARMPAGLSRILRGAWHPLEAAQAS